MLPQGTSDSIATTSSSRSTASTKRHSPSAGSPSRPSAMENPRSEWVSRQALAREMMSAISSAEMSRCRRMRTVNPGPARPGHGLAHPAHIGAGQPEVGGPQDRLVAQFQRVEATLAIDPCPLGAGAHHTGCPAVALAQPQPGVDGLRPRPGVAYRVAAARQTPTSTRKVMAARPLWANTTDLSRRVAK